MNWPRGEASWGPVSSGSWRCQNTPAAEGFLKNSTGEIKCVVGDGWSAPFRLRRRSIWRACFDIVLLIPCTLDTGSGWWWTRGRKVLVFCLDRYVTTELWGALQRQNYGKARARHRHFTKKKHMGVFGQAHGQLRDLCVCAKFMVRCACVRTRLPQSLPTYVIPQLQNGERAHGIG